MIEPPQFPAGSFDENAPGNKADRDGMIDVLAAAPAALRGAVQGLDDAQLDTRYRNWTVRQIVHHLADSHLNSYVRCKWALTEDRPLIKAYDESAWSTLPDARRSAIGPSLRLLEGLHERWVALLRVMNDGEFERTFVHPETGAAMTLNAALAYYAWHGRHHTAQIEWVCANRF